MNVKEDHDYFTVSIVDNTREKAIKVRLQNSGKFQWIPRSLCSIKLTPGHDDQGILEVESWFAEKEGMHE